MVPLCVCVCVIVPPPPFRHDRLSAAKFGTHVRIDPGIIRAQNKLTHPPQGGSHRGFRGSNIIKSGKCYVLPRKSIQHLTPTPPDGVYGGGVWGGGSFRDNNFKSSGNFMNCRENRLISQPLTPTHLGVVRMLSEKSCIL